MRKHIVPTLLALSLSVVCATEASAHGRRHHRHHRHVAILPSPDQGFLYQFFHADPAEATVHSFEFSYGGKAYRRARELAAIVGVRPSLAADVVKWESGGRYAAKASTTSASGPMQVVDRTARSIAGHNVSRRERMSDTGIKLGVAYLAACQEALPSASNRAVWRRCYYLGHANVGARIGTAQRAFQTLAFR